MKVLPYLCMASFSSHMLFLLAVLLPTILGFYHTSPWLAPQLSGPEIHNKHQPFIFHRNTLLGAEKLFHVQESVLS